MSLTLKISSALAAAITATGATSCALAVNSLPSTTNLSSPMSAVTTASAAAQQVAVNLSAGIVLAGFQPAEYMLDSAPIQHSNHVRSC